MTDTTEARAAFARVREYVSMRIMQPLPQSGDVIHCIHAGTQWHGEPLLSDLRAIVLMAARSQDIATTAAEAMREACAAKLSWIADEIVATEPEGVEEREHARLLLKAAEHVRALPLPASDPLDAPEPKEVYLIHFSEDGIKPELFAGYGVNYAAVLARYRAVSTGYNCRLFQMIDPNSKPASDTAPQETVGLTMDEQSVMRRALRRAAQPAPDTSAARIAELEAVVRMVEKWSISLGDVEHERAMIKAARAALTPGSEQGT